MDISYKDVYKDKLNYITCRTEKIRNAIDEEYGTHFPGDYDDIKKICKSRGWTIAFCINNINEIRIDVPNGWCILDAYGEIVGAGGKYEPFLELNSSVTELENTLQNDLAEIRAMKYDVEFTETPIISDREDL